MDMTVGGNGAVGSGPGAGAGAAAARQNRSAGAPRAARIGRLSAGVVPGGVNFDAPLTKSGSLPLHAAPADRNTAATGVALGRVLDVTA